MLNNIGPVIFSSVSTNSNLFIPNGTVYPISLNGLTTIQLDTNGNLKWMSNISDSTVSIGFCRSDLFYNIYVSYFKSTNYYIRKIDKNGNINWTKTFTYSPNKFTMNVFFEQDVTLVCYKNNDISTANLLQFDVNVNVPGNQTGISLFDAEGNYITPYSTPVSNIFDFTTRTKDLYYVPLYNGQYFSNLQSYLDKTVYNYWNVLFQGDGSSSQKIIDVKNNDYVITGQYGPDKTFIFPSSTIYLPELDRLGSFLIKLDSSRNINWVSYIENTVTNSKPYSISFDSITSNIFISGTFGNYRSNIYNSDGSKFQGYLPDFANDTAVYLIKYNTNGFVEWQTYINRINDEDSSFIMNSKNSNVYIYCESSLNSGNVSQIYDAKLFGDRVPTLSALSCPSSSSLFLVKYNSSGQSQWIVYVQNAVSSFPYLDGRNSVIDSNENVYICFQRYVQYNTNYVIQSNGVQYPIGIDRHGIAKLNKDGMVLLAYKIGCGGLQSMTVDSNDSVYFGGRWDTFHWGGPIEFYEWTGSGISGSTVSTLNVPHGNGSTFYAKYNSNGTFAWRAAITNPPGNTGEVIPQSISVDSNGNLYGAGRYAIIGNATVITIYNSNDTAFSKTITAPILGEIIGGYIVKYNSSGMCQWVCTVYPLYSQTDFSIKCDNDDNILVSFEFTKKTTTRFYDSLGGEHYINTELGYPSRTSLMVIKLNANGFLIPV